MPSPSLPPAAAPSAYLVRPFADLQGWLRFFKSASIPVLAQTAAELEELREREDDVDAGMLTAMVQRDPLMMLKLLAHVATKRRPGEGTDIETVTSALVMTGISPFFRDFGPQPTVEAHLSAEPVALEGLRALLWRARRAAHFAMAFAVHRGDTDAEVIYQAALLHDFVEMLMWCHAPTLQLQFQELQQSRPQERSAVLQQEVFRVDFGDLSQALMRLRRLPSLMVRISDDKHAEHPSVRNVVLAVRLARHTAQSWDNPAVPDDLTEIAQLLNANERVTLSFLRKIDLEPQAP